MRVCVCVCLLVTVVTSVCVCLFTSRRVRCTKNTFEKAGSNSLSLSRNPDPVTESNPQTLL